jgi:hypothetical protein
MGSILLLYCNYIVGTDYMPWHGGINQRHFHIPAQLQIGSDKVKTTQEKLQRHFQANQEAVFPYTTLF